MAILHNVNSMTHVFNELKSEGYDIKEEDMSGFSPYRTEHFSRLGSFELNLKRKVAPMDYTLDL